MAQPLMPHATAAWLVENTSLTFEQIAQCCGLHILEVQAIADDTAATKLTGRDPIRAGELTMDQDTHEVTVGNEPIELSPTEFKLLRYLMLNPNRVLSKAQILDHVWEYDFNGDAGIVESYISYLRRKLDAHSTEPIIQTKRGFGYMLKAAKV